MRGIFFEKERNRWRTRLYIGGKVCHCRYHATEAEAITDYIQAKEKTRAQKTQLRDKLPSQPASPPATPAAVLLHILTITASPTRRVVN